MEKILKCRNHARRIASFAIIIITISLIMVHETIVNSTYALTRYYNCVTRVANSNGSLTLENVETCYYKVFQGARDADADGNKLKLD
jgi:hypothetical protein